MNNRASCRTADRCFNWRFQIGKHQLNPEELAKKMEEVAADTQQFSTMNESHFEGLTTTPSSFGPKETMDWLEAEIRAKGMTVFGCIDHSAGKTWMSYDEPEFYHENIARYCSTHNYCSAGCSSR